VDNNQLMETIKTTSLEMFECFKWLYLMELNTFLIIVVLTVVVNVDNQPILFQLCDTAGQVNICISFAYCGYACRGALPPVRQRANRPREKAAPINRK